MCRCWFCSPAWRFHIVLASRERCVSQCAATVQCVVAVIGGEAPDMDGQRFDRLTRALATGTSRRTILKGLLGAGGAAVSGSVVADQADARVIGARPTVPPAQQPSGCQLPNQLCGGECCGPGLCKSNHCCSSPTHTWCGDRCWPESQCTSSGIPCSDGQKVCGSTCCPANASCARSGNSDICCNPDSGQAPCGFECCATAAQCCDRECCPDGSVCIGNGYCCPFEQMCGGICCNGPGQRCCHDVCIEAGQCCGDDECQDSPATCQAGYCDLNSSSCALTDPCADQPGTTCCGGACIELGTTTHCLSCDNACGSGQVCCAAGCTTLGTDDHCAACDDACTGGFACIDGACRCDEDSDCGSGLLCCDHVCQPCCGDNVSNCGDNKCETWTCNAGACLLAATFTCSPPTVGDCLDAGSCDPATGLCVGRQYLGDDMACGAPGDFCCDGSCISSDVDNCGFCGQSCPAGFVCSGGECRCNGDIDCAFLTGGCEVGQCQNGVCTARLLTNRQPCIGQDGACDEHGFCVTECEGTDASTCPNDACTTYACQAGRCVASQIVICNIGLFPTCRPITCDPVRGCVEGDAVPDGQDCGIGGICCNGNCLPKDEENCGACGNVCPQGFVCQGNACACDGDGDCDAGEVCCQGVCQECCDSDPVSCPAASSECVTSVCNADGTCGEVNKAEFTSCGQNQRYCIEGACEYGCNIGGTFYPVNAANPANLCQICEPVISRTSWTSKTCTILVEGCEQFVCDAADGACKRTNRANGTACSVTQAQPNFCSAQGNGTCLDGQCLTTPLNEGAACGTANNNCHRRVCRDGICASEATNEGDSCIGPNPAKCHRANGTCRGGNCVNQRLPNGTVCDEKPQGCNLGTCLDGLCSYTPVRTGESCDRGITECREGWVCASNGGCSQQILPNRNFCEYSKLSRCEENRLSEGTCNGDGTCSGELFQSGVILCENPLTPRRACCPGMVCECPPQSGVFCIEKFCYYPEEVY